MKKEIYFDINLYFLDDFLENFAVHLKMALNFFS
jgi:hypothetical protein